MDNKDTIHIPAQTRIAQIRFVQNTRVTFKEVSIDEISNNESRGGIGSTGK